MQKFSKEELQEQADKFMAAHGVDSFLATEDGNFFHPKDKGLAHDHNNKNVKGEVIEFGKEAADANVEAPKAAVKEQDVDTHGDIDEAIKDADAKKAADAKEAAKKKAADEKTPDTKSGK